MVATAYAHIVVDEKGRAWIEDTGVKVLQIIWEWQVKHYTPEEFCQKYPYLSLADIHAAFVYYYDHKEKIDAQIEAERALVERALAASPGPDPDLLQRIQEAKTFGSR